MSITVRVEGLDDLKNNLNKAGETLKKNLGDAMQKSTEIIKLKARRKAGSPPIVFKGELARSIQAKSSPFKGVVGAEAKHAPFIEFGTKPHFPPIAPLERWARLKLGKPGIGFAIAKKISERGTKAQPYFQPAVDESINDIARFFEQSIDKVTVELTK